MTAEILMHYDEDLSPPQLDKLLETLGNDERGLHATHYTDLPHLLFVAYDDAVTRPHDLVVRAETIGVHAQLIDL